MRLRQEQQWYMTQDPRHGAQQCKKRAARRPDAELVPEPPTDEDMGTNSTRSSTCDTGCVVQWLCKTNVSVLIRPSGKNASNRFSFRRNNRSRK